MMTQMPIDNREYDLPTYWRRHERDKSLPTSPATKTVPVSPTPDLDTPTYLRRRLQNEKSPSLPETKADSPPPTSEETSQWSEPITSIIQLQQLQQQEQILGAQVEDFRGDTLQLADIQLGDQPHLEHLLKGNYVDQQGRLVSVRLNLFRADGNFNPDSPYRSLRLKLRSPQSKDDGPPNSNH